MGGPAQGRGSLEPGGPAPHGGRRRRVRTALGPRLQETDTGLAKACRDRGGLRFSGGGCGLTGGTPHLLRGRHAPGMPTHLPGRPAAMGTQGMCQPPPRRQNEGNSVTRVRKPPPAPLQASMRSPHTLKASSKHDAHTQTVPAVLFTHFTRPAGTSENKDEASSACCHSQEVQKRPMPKENCGSTRAAGQQSAPTRFPRSRQQSANH